jgi:ABC-type polysaccharide/polyol phosphate transport system ATPase subunit
MTDRKRRERLMRAPVVMVVDDVHKTFRIPDQKYDTLKERIVNARRQNESRELRALRGVSFDVHSGEFFGIVGRNGSGKSTLLKILASIYRADRGRIRVAGRLAPFIELGVGFNAELTARENVELNGVMMGLSRREARKRLDSVLDFGELREFVDLKFKNYSSGMMVRLAFAAMVEADADVMLIDEVLAVGDAAFAKKCNDVFRERRSRGKTIVLVTHDMATVQATCDRAMLLHDGEQEYLGEPEEAALRYYRFNFATDSGGDAEPSSVLDVNVNLVDAWFEDPSGDRVDNVEQGTAIRLCVLTEARRDMDAPAFNFQCLNVDGNWVFSFSKAIEDPSGAPVRVMAGERMRIVAEIENPLTPGRYSIECWISRTREHGGAMAIHMLRLLDFYVFGTKPGAGSIALDHEAELEIEPASRR